MGAQLKVIAPKVGGIKGSDGGTIRADFQLAGGPSVLFDTVVLALSREGAAMLAKVAYQQRPASYAGIWVTP